MYRNRLILGTLVLLTAATVLALPRIVSKRVEAQERKARKGQFDQLKLSLSQYTENFPGKISVFIKDLKTGEALEINANQLFASASLVKIPLMAAVFAEEKRGNLLQDEKLLCRKRNYTRGSGQLKYCGIGKKFKISELMDYMITHSDNVATNMLTDKLGLETISGIFTRDFGLKITNMDRSIMDLRARRKGIENYTTAREMGELLDKIYTGELVSKRASGEMLAILRNQQIADRIPKYLPKELVIAHKTGLMRNSCHDAGIVFTQNGDFIVVVLTEKIRAKTAKKLIAGIAYKAYSVYQ
ncbi:MAG TPA: serine hydrolase [bacterium]|nr:serine hydrolase [bacterium]